MKRSPQTTRTLAPTLAAHGLVLAPLLTLAAHGLVLAPLLLAACATTPGKSNHDLQRRRRGAAAQPGAREPDWLGEALGHTSAEARRRALGELAGQLTVRVQQRCVERSRSSDVDGRESQASQSDCTTELRSVSDPRFGDWATLARCQTTAVDEGFRARCRLAPKALRRQLTSRLEPQWRRYMTLSEALVRPPGAEARAWHAKHRLFSTLQAELWPVLDASRAVGLGLPEREALMRRRANTIAMIAQAQRDQREVLLHMVEPSALAEGIQGRFAGVLEAAGLRHRIASACEAPNQLLLRLRAEARCAANPMTGFSGCRAILSGTVEACGQPARSVRAELGPVAVPAGTEGRLPQRMASIGDDRVREALSRLLNDQVSLQP